MNATVLSHAEPVPDAIDALAGIAGDTRLQAIRSQREQARSQAQQSHLALFAPRAPLAGAFAVADRFAVAVFVAQLHRHAPAARFYAQGLLAQGASAELARAIEAEAERGAAQGPYGRYPAGPLSAEDAAGPSYAVGEPNRTLLGPRLSAALAHVHLLVFHPRDASAGGLQRLLDAGWSSTDIVTLSQLVSFLAFQIRVATGLRVLSQTTPAKD